MSGLTSTRVTADQPRQVTLEGLLRRQQQGREDSSLGDTGVGSTGGNVEAALPPNETLGTQCTEQVHKAATTLPESHNVASHSSCPDESISPQANINHSLKDTQTVTKSPKRHQSKLPFGAVLLPLSSIHLQSGPMGLSVYTLPHEQSHTQFSVADKKSAGDDTNATSCDTYGCHTSSSLPVAHEASDQDSSEEQNELRVIPVEIQADGHQGLTSGAYTGDDTCRTFQSAGTLTSIKEEVVLTCETYEQETKDVSNCSQTPGPSSTADTQDSSDYTCPVCGRPVVCDSLASFNEHIDLCLFTSAGAQPAGDAADPPQDVTPKEEEAPLRCPVCNIVQVGGSLLSFNHHVDTCLNKSTIRQILTEQGQGDPPQRKRSLLLQLLKIESLPQSKCKIDRIVQNNWH